MMYIYTRTRPDAKSYFKSIIHFSESNTKSPAGHTARPEEQ